ncbi:MAG: DUF2306 domain-containing protein [Flavobacteriaceae bacterium]
MMDKVFNGRVAVTFWFVVTLIGQWIFALYVAIYHGYTIVDKGLGAMGGKHMPNGYLEGDATGNLTLASHLILAVFVIAAGPLQLIPKIQREYRSLHKWMGRIYLPLVVIIAIGGVYLTWSRPRPSFGSIYQDIAISMEALLIVIFAMLAWRSAIQRKIHRHRKWALRLFITASGVWFLRIGYKAWFWIEELLEFSIENFFDYWSFGSFLIPLGVLELYLRTMGSGNKKAERRMAILLMLLTLFMALGIFLAAKGMWWPRMISVW